MQRVLAGGVLEGLEVDVMSLDGDEHAVREQGVVVSRCRALLGVFVAEHRSVAGVDEQHLAGAEAPALDHVLRRHLDHAGL